MKISERFNLCLKRFKKNGIKKLKNNNKFNKLKKISINDKEKAGLKIISRSHTSCPNCNNDAIEFKFSDEKIIIICTECGEIEKEYFIKV